MRGIERSPAILKSNQIDLTWAIGWLAESGSRTLISPGGEISPLQSQSGEVGPAPERFRLSDRHFVVAREFVLNPTHAL